MRIKTEDGENYDAVPGAKNDGVNPFSKIGADKESASEGYDRPRVKDRSASFKSKKHVDVVAESSLMRKQKREEHLQKIRKLEIVQHKLSPKKLDFIPEENDNDIDDDHDFGYDPSAEMRASFARVSDMGNNSGASSSAHGTLANAPVTMHALSKLFDQKLSPLHSSMYNLEKKFQSLQIDADSDISTMHDEITDKLNDVDEKLDMHDVNLDNMDRRMDEHEKQSWI